MHILIKNVELNKIEQDIFIEDNKIAKIGQQLPFQADKIIDGSRKAAVPGMVNGHTHAAMTLMRGYADDMPLKPWLEQKIWPLEAKLTEEDVYWGAKLACLEMIKTGTTTMVDMYHHFPGTAKAADEMGLRGMLTFAGFDFNQPELASSYKTKVQELLQSMSAYSNRIRFAMGPHAIYTVSTNLLKWIKEFATANGLKIHTHLSETKGEIDEAQKLFGMRPAHYLHSIGFLGPEVSFAIAST
jgi:5-methylthioadenosine/S-adenosylhomocysteine deaminase